MGATFSGLGFARGVGIEKTLEVRRRIKKVEYSQKTISVEFVYDGADLRRPTLSAAPETVESEGGRPRSVTLFSDGEPRTSAGHGATTPERDADGLRRAERNGEGCPEPFPRSDVFGAGPSPAPKKKEPVPQIGTDSSSWLDTDRNLAINGVSKTIVFSFPNIAHNYWDNFRLTREFYVRPAEPVNC